MLNNFIYTLLHSSSQRIAVLRGSLVGAFLFIIVAFFLSLVMPTGAENFDRVPLIPALLVLILTSFLVLVLPRRRSVFLFTLLVGGMMANFLESHLFSPVSDYILIPGTSDHYCNLADVGIVFGPIIYAIFALLELIRLEKAYREKRLARSLTASQGKAA